MGVSVASALLFGLIPPRRSSGMDVGGLLKVSTLSSREAGRTRSALLVGEVALSMMLLAGAGLLVRSFVGLRSLSPGFDAEGVLTLGISVPDAHYKNSLALQSYWDEALAKLGGLPGVASVAAVTPLPLSGDDFSSSFSVEGRSVPDKDQPSAEVRVATPDYFRAMAIPLLKGRGFIEADRLGAARVLLIGERAARMFFPAGDAIGQKVRFGARGGYEKNEGEIVGIVGDVRHFGLDAPIPPIFYVPLAQAGIDGGGRARASTGDGHEERAATCSFGIGSGTGCSADFEPRAGGLARWRQYNGSSNIGRHGPGVANRSDSRLLCTGVACGTAGSDGGTKV